MAEKYCKYCNKTKSISKFNKSSVHKDGYNSKCKKCSNEYLAKFRCNRDPVKRKLQAKEEYNKRKDLVKQYFFNRKDGFYHVYILNKEHYAGCTDSPVTRKTGHKSLGRYVEDMRVVASFNNREDALELEEFLHDLGYQGRHTKYSYK